MKAKLVIFGMIILSSICVSALEGNISHGINFVDEATDTLNRLWGFVIIINEENINLTKIIKHQLSEASHASVFYAANQSMISIAAFSGYNATFEEGVILTNTTPYYVLVNGTGNWDIRYTTAGLAFPYNRTELCWNSSIRTNPGGEVGGWVTSYVVQANDITYLIYENITGPPPTNTCDPPATGNYINQCSDNCNWTEGDVIPGNITMNGTGINTLSARWNFTSTNQWIFQGSGCEFRITTGGSFG